MVQQVVEKIGTLQPSKAGTVLVTETKENQPKSSEKPYDSL